MFQCILQRMKLNGYEPDTILDIGSHHGNWTKECRKIYPDANYFLFEAIDYMESRQIMNVKQFNCLLSDKQETVDWYELRNTGDSMFKEMTHNFENCVPTKRNTTTLYDVINVYLPSMKQVFIKIDCQGAEIPILKGAGDSLLSKTDFILLEIPYFGVYNQSVPSYLEHIQYMDSIGFIPFDHCENHYVANFNIQADILFIKKDYPFNQLVQTRMMQR